MGRSKEFSSGHTPLEEYRSFAEERPTHATAREIVAKSIPADLGKFTAANGKVYPLPFSEIPKDTPEKVMDRKYESAQTRGIVDDVLKRGVLHPIRMVPDGAYPPDAVSTSLDDKVPLLWNGQHRVAVMYRHHPDEPIPLDWDSFEGFEDRRGNTKYNAVIPPAPKPKRAR